MSELGASRCVSYRLTMLRTLAFVAIAITLAGVVMPSPLPAQTPPAPSDSARRDSTRADSSRRDTVSLSGEHAMEAALYLLVAAPAGLVSMMSPDSVPVPNPLGYTNDHLSMYGSGGLASGRRGPILGASWTGTGSIELLARGILLEGRLEQFQLMRHVEYRTLRAGRIWRPVARVAGGITVGYRDAPGLRRQQGVEIAFPFIGGGSRTWTRLESSYVLSNRQSSWNYRVQWEHRPRGGPLIIGSNIELDSWEIRKHGQLSHGSFGLLVGTTLGR